MTGTIERSILMVMRRLLPFAMLLALALPGASAARERTPSDGTLSVRDGRGTIVVNARGGVIGSFAQGKMTIIDPVEGDGTGPIVSGEEFYKGIDEKTDFYRGTKVRFRLIGGAFKVRIQGRGINLSVVGKGSVTLNGAGTGDDGAFSVNGGDYTAIPDTAVVFQLSATSP
jgi:hypothetical protein